MNSIKQIIVALLLYVPLMYGADESKENIKQDCALRSFQFLNSPLETSCPHEIEAYHRCIARQKQSEATRWIARLVFQESTKGEGIFEAGRGWFVKR